MKQGKFVDVKKIEEVLGHPKKMVRKERGMSVAYVFFLYLSVVFYNAREKVIAKWASKYNLNFRKYIYMSCDNSLQFGNILDQ